MMPSILTRRATAPEMQLATAQAAMQGSIRVHAQRFLLVLALALGLLLQALPALAQTAVSGAIDTRWTTAGAPYIVG